MVGPALLAQTTQALKSGAKLTVEAGEVVYVVNALQSNVNGSSFGNFLCSVQLGSNQVAVGLNPFKLGPEGYGPAVLAGPAEIAVKGDSVINYYKINARGFQSIAFWKDMPAVILVATNGTCTLFPPLVQDGYSTRDFVSQIEVSGMTLTNVHLFPPIQLSGPATVTLKSSIPTIATFQMSALQTNVVSQGSASQSILVEGSDNLVNWMPVFKTNTFRLSQGFFRLKTAD